MSVRGCAWLCDVIVTSRMLLGAWQVLGDVRVRLLIVSCQCLTVTSHATSKATEPLNVDVTAVRYICNKNLHQRCPYMIAT